MGAAAGPEGAAVAGVMEKDGDQLCRLNKALWTTSLSYRYSSVCLCVSVCAFCKVSELVMLGDALIQDERKECIEFKEA